MQDAFVIGSDFGTDSVRVVLVNVRTGEEVGQGIAGYSRWRDGLYCNPSSNQFRQHPLDYLESLERAMQECLKVAGPSVRSRVRAISADTTGSTPVAVDRSGTPLALLPGFEENPNAMFVLWKDHTALKEAQEINDHAARRETDYLRYVGGIYSSEWFWAKLLHVLRRDTRVREACYSWVEHCDWIPFALTGGRDLHSMKRSVCAAGHKALWAEAFGGLPSDDFFASLDPLLKDFTTRLYSTTCTSDQAAGTLDPMWSRRLGLPSDVIVGVGAFDCHMGAVGGQIEPWYLSKVMGTSTCDMMVIPKDEMKEKVVRGICGQVDGSIIPGMIGLEAGQSAFGDTYAWFKNLLSWPATHLLNDSAVIDRDTARALGNELSERLIPELSRQAALLPIEINDELALDWLNGRRTPDADQSLKGAMDGLTLASDGPGLFKAWVEATCFGAKAIVDRFVDDGLAPKGIIGLGGVARKSPYVMQVMSNVLDMRISVHKSEQTCALGAAMFAATAANLYPNVERAMDAMGQGFDLQFEPQKEKALVYAARYQRYRELASRVERNRPAKHSTNNDD